MCCHPTWRSWPCSTKHQNAVHAVPALSTFRATAKTNKQIFRWPSGHSWERLGQSLAPSQGFHVCVRHTFRFAVTVYFDISGIRSTWKRSGNLLLRYELRTIKRLFKETMVTLARYYSRLLCEWPRVEVRWNGWSRWTLFSLHSRFQKLDPRGFPALGEAIDV